MLEDRPLVTTASGMPHSGKGGRPEPVTADVLHELPPLDTVVDTKVLATPSFNTIASSSIAFLNKGHSQLSSLTRVSS